MLSRLTKKRRFSVRSSRGVGSGPVVISYGFRIRLELFTEARLDIGESGRIQLREAPFPIRTRLN